MTLFISELDVERRKVLTTGIIDLGVAFLLWIFSAIYIACGHGKTSGGMVCLLLPFFVSGMMFLIGGFTELYSVATLPVRCLWNLAMASISVGMALIGIFEIAGVSSSKLLIFIWIGAAICLAGSIFIGVFNLIKVKDEET